MAGAVDTWSTLSLSLSRRWTPEALVFSLLIFDKRARHVYPSPDARRSTAACGQRVNDADCKTAADRNSGARAAAAAAVVVHIFQKKN